MTVLIKPHLWPARLIIERTRKATVVFPFVPVTARLVSFEAGLPLAACARMAGVGVAAVWLAGAGLLQATLPVLWLAVKEFGWISPQVEAIVGEVLGRPVNQVHEVVTFYTMFPRMPMGEHQIEICRNLSCWLAKAPDLLEHLKEKLGIHPGEVSADGRFSLIEVECLAYCECAPAMRIDGRYEGNLTREKIDQLIDDID